MNTIVNTIESFTKEIALLNTEIDDLLSGKRTVKVLSQGKDLKTKNDIISSLEVAKKSLEQARNYLSNYIND